MIIYKNNLIYFFYKSLKLLLLQFSIIQFQSFKTFYHIIPTSFAYQPVPTLVYLIATFIIPTHAS